MLELLSVHVPKCAGTSFRQTLTQHYGEDGIWFDYGDRPADPAAPMHLDPEGFLERFRTGGYPFLAGRRAVHGHFHVGKYRYLDDAGLRVTVLRHPVERTVSHYRHWQRSPRNGHSLQNYVLDHGLDLMAFARLPFIRHFYARVFFGGVDMTSFHLIGGVETLERDLADLSERLGWQVDLPRLNTGGTPSTVDPDTYAALSDLLREDIAFYRRWAGWRRPA